MIVETAPRAEALTAPDRGKSVSFANDLRTPSRTRLVTLFLLAAPALLIGFLIFSYGVDTPWGDQWDGTLPLFEKAEADTLGPADFFALHNEHRILFPRLIAFGLARVTHWNIRAEMLIIWVLACVCAINVACIARVTGGSRLPHRDWLALGASVMLFTPLQWENLLWGFQIGFFLPLASTTACFCVARAVRRPFNFLITGVLCLISTFSIASGFSAWLLTAPILFYSPRAARRRSDWISWSLWVTSAVASVSLYFHGFTRPVGHPGPLQALQHPIEALQFALAYLGYPFATGTMLETSPVAQVAGLALTASLLGCLAYLWRCRRDQALVANALPWLSLASVALVNAILTALGRLGLEMGAMQSRYVSFAVMLPIALLYLVPLLLRHWRGRSVSHVDRSSISIGLKFLLGTLALLFVCGSIHSLARWPRFHHERLTGKAALLLINVLHDPPAFDHYVHTDDPALKSRTNLLNRLGYLRPALVKTDRIREIARATTETTGGLTQLDVSTRGDVRAGGWAILPERRRMADSVLLTYEDERQDPIIFARADVGLEIPNADERLDDKGYSRSGWVASWNAETLPASARQISAWAFDAEEGHAFYLDSSSIPQRQASE